MYNLHDLGVHSFPARLAHSNGAPQPDASGGYGVSHEGPTLMTASASASASASAAQAINAGSTNGSAVGESWVVDRSAGPETPNAFEGNHLALAKITQTSKRQLETVEPPCNPVLCHWVTIPSAMPSPFPASVPHSAAAVLSLTIMVRSYLPAAAALSLTVIARSNPMATE